MASGEGTVAVFESCISGAMRLGMEREMLMSIPKEKAQSLVLDKWYYYLSTCNQIELPVAAQRSISVSQMQKGTIDSRRIQAYYILQRVL